VKSIKSPAVRGESTKQNKIKSKSRKEKKIIGEELKIEKDGKGWKRDLRIWFCFLFKIGNIIFI